MIPQTPLTDLAASLPYKLPSIGSPMHEDPSLVLLFAQLRSWSLQTVKGAIAVPGKTEFNVRSLLILSRMSRLILSRSLFFTWLECSVGWVSVTSRRIARVLD